MLIINVDNLRKYNQELKQLIKSYEENYSTILHEISNANFSWQDDNSEKFFLDIATQKSKFSEFIENLESVSSANQTAEKSIKKLDASIEKILVNFDYKESIMNTFNSLIARLDRANKRLSSLSIEFCSYSEIAIIKNQINSIKNCVLRLKNSKNKVQELFTETEKIENELKLKLLNLNIVKIDEFDNQQYL